MREIHGRLARLERQTPSRRLPHRCRSHRPPEGNAESLNPQATTGSLARAASEFQQAQKHNPNVPAALRSLIAQQGERTAASLDAAKVQTAASAWAKFSPHTRATYSKCLRRFLLWLEEIGAAPKTISRSVPRFMPPQARTSIATDDERERLLAGARPHLRFFLLLCCDLGIRHRTAARMTLEMYDPNNRSFRFETKGHVWQALPVTDAIAEVITSLPDNSPRQQPIVNLLRPARHPGQIPGSRPRMGKAWTKLKAKVGVRADLRIHDLRRTVAEDVWEATHDLRKVQAQLGHRSPVTTAVYLANRLQLADLQPVLAEVQKMRAQRRRKAERTP